MKEVCRSEIYILASALLGEFQTLVVNTPPHPIFILNGRNRTDLTWFNSQMNKVKFLINVPYASPSPSKHIRKTQVGSLSSHILAFFFSFHVLRSPFVPSSSPLARFGWQKYRLQNWQTSLCTRDGTTLPPKVWPYFPLEAQDNLTLIREDMVIRALVDSLIRK